MSKGFRPLFLTGVARSGTNLVGRMLCAHPEAMVAIDAYLPLFRSFRNALFRKREDHPGGNSFDPESPLRDFYFEDGQTEDLDFICQGDLDLPFDGQEWPKLLERLVSRASDDASDLLPYLGELGGAKSYRDLFDGALEIIAKARSAHDRAWIGPKDVWVIDFLPALARSFPEAKFVVIFRDPRAVVGSNQPAKGTSQFGHPISYARHWRKNVSMTVQYRTDPALSSRICVVFYEAVLQDPQGEASRLCEFLDLPFDPAMVDPTAFKDFTRGGVWAGNSSFENRPEIDRGRADRWRRVLEPEIAGMVDLVCGPEMRFAGYEPDRDYRVENPGPEILEYFIRSNREACSWRSDSGDPQRDFGNELFRYALLGVRKGIASRDMVRRCFLFEKVYELLREAPEESLRRNP